MLKLTPEEKREALRNCNKYFFTWVDKVKERERQERNLIRYLNWREIAKYVR